MVGLLHDLRAVRLRRARHGAAGSSPGINIFALFRYLAREFLLILATSSSESALPRLIAKMEHAGVDKTTVGIVVPTGYSFNLDGTAIYLTMATLFIAEAMGDPLSHRLADLAAGVHDHRLEGRRRRHRRRAGDPGRRPAVAPPGAGRRRRPDRRHRPVHVRGARADQLRRQLGRHRADRQLDRRRRPRADGQGARRRPAVRRDHDDRRADAASRRRRVRTVATAAVSERARRSPAARSRRPARPSPAAPR